MFNGLKQWIEELRCEFKRIDIEAERERERAFQERERERERAFQERERERAIEREREDLAFQERERERERVHQENVKEIEERYARWAQNARDFFDKRK